MSPRLGPDYSLQGRRGFTLVELLVVVLLIGILAAIALPRLLGQRTRSRNAAAQVAVRHALVAVRSWYASDGRESYAGLCADAANARAENRCSGKTALSSLESSLGTAEPADTQRPGSSANPQEIWMGNGVDGTDPSGSTVTLCSASRGDTVYCIRDADGVASYYAFTGAGVSAGGDGSLYSASGWSAPAPVSTPGFAFRKKLLIKTSTGGAGLSGSLSNFPVAVVVNSSSWPTQSERDSFFAGTNNVAGKRVEFRASDGSTVLPYEVEKFTAGSEAVYWVKVPSLAVSDSSNYIWLYYGNDPNGSDRDQASQVWDANFAAVYHLSGLGDSTTNGNALTNNNSAVSGGGQIGDRYLFNGTSQYLATAASSGTSSLDCTSATLEALFNRSSSPASVYERIFFKSSPNTPDNNYGLQITNTKKLRADFSYNAPAPNAKGYIDSTTTAATSSWIYGAATYDESSGYAKIYYNGSNETTIAWVAGALSRYSGPLELGRNYINGSADYNFNGQIDEVRVSRTVRSADWIRATHYSLRKTSWSGDGWLAWDPAQSL